MTSSIIAMNCSRTTSRKFWTPRGTRDSLLRPATATAIRMIITIHVYVTWSGTPGRRKIGGCSITPIASAPSLDETARDEDARQHRQARDDRDGMCRATREDERDGGGDPAESQDGAEGPPRRRRRGGGDRASRQPPEVAERERATREDPEASR